MRNMNRITLLGNVVADPEMRSTESGKTLARFRLATNRKWKTKDGRTSEETEFHSIVAWSQLADICQKYVKRGMPLLVEGRLQNRSYQGKDGVMRRAYEIVLDEMNILDFSRRRERESSGSAGDELYEKISATPLNTVV